MSEWQLGDINSLMIQDETVSPGYCMLQLLRKDDPLPYNFLPNDHFFRDITGRILFKNTSLSEVAGRVYEGSVQHGPAAARRGIPGLIDYDFVGGFYCKSWPLQAKQWFENQAEDNYQGEGHWPSRDRRRYCRSTGCFAVAVGSNGSINEELELRISTSLAERCLMFSLNITQIRCYVLMKMNLYQTKLWRHDYKLFHV